MIRNPKNHHELHKKYWRHFSKKLPPKDSYRGHKFGFSPLKYIWNDLFDYKDRILFHFLGQSNFSVDFLWIPDRSSCRHTCFFRFLFYQSLKCTVNTKRILIIPFFISIRWFINNLSISIEGFIISYTYISCLSITLKA